MSSNATLKAVKRESAGKGVARKLRGASRIPAVVYGGGKESISLTLDAHETEVLFHRISVDNTIVSLKIEGAKSGVDTLIREVQTHPYKPVILHVDFLRLRKGVAVDVDVPIDLDGTPEGVRTGGGLMEQILHSIEVRCIPSKIPESIVIDVTGLEVGDSIHVADLPAIEGVEFQADPTQTICAIVLPKVVEEEVEEEELLELEEAEAAEEEADEETSSEERSAGGASDD